MPDETIAPTLYRTGRGDRSSPLFLGLLLMTAGPLLAWTSGPFLLPWGAALGSCCLGLATAALVRWRRARDSVVWDGEALEFRRGSRGMRIPVGQLTRMQTIPSSACTLLWVGKLRYRLSHRLVRAEALLEELRKQRPDLAAAGEPLVFRRSAASALIQGGLAAGTLAAGVLLAEWQPVLGWFFGAAAFYVLLRIAFFIPRSYTVGPQTLVVRYWLRRKRWGRPLSIRDDGYSAGGAVFFRMVVSYGRWKVVLDEGLLVDPIRPRADTLARLLLPPLASPPT